MLRALGGGTLFGSVVGDGPPRVLLLHGWRRTHADFVTVQDQLAGHGLASVAVDLPGFGAAPPPEQAGGARHYAELIRPALDELADAGAVVLVGHSFGGRVATVLAARHPDTVAAAVVAGAPLLRLGPAARAAGGYRWVRWLHQHGLVSGERLEAARHRYGSDDYRAASGVVRDVLVISVSETYEDEIDELAVPLSLVWGGNDTVVPVAVAEAVVERRRRRGGVVALDVVPGGDHLVPLSAPEHLVRAVAGLVR
ncbi:MAG: alpha/beta fold hydrolase [Acidimicrobiales bacterium]